MSTILLLLSPVLLAIVLTKYLKISNENFKLLLVFSGAFLLSFTFLEIFPEVYQSPKGGYFILFGVMIQLFLEFTTKGMEHGHLHGHGDKKNAMLVFSGLFLHGFFDGIPLASHPNLLPGLLIHKLPISMVLWLFLSHGFGTNLRTILMLLFGFSTPLGFVFSYWIEDSFLLQALVGIVGGMFLHISSVIIFESQSDHRFNIKRLLSILLGVLICIATAYH